MEQKIKEENTKKNLVFFIDRRKLFAIKSTQRKSFFSNPSDTNKVRVFYFGLFIKQ